MVFIYNSFLNLCGSPSIPIRIGSQGFAIGRALKLGSEILYVEPQFNFDTKYYYDRCQQPNNKK